MDKFLSNASRVLWFDDPTISIFQTNFDTNYYSQTLVPILNPNYKKYIHNATIKRKAEFIAGRYCAQQSLARWQVPDEIIGIGDGRHPVWPVGIVGSISHCRSYAIAATSQTRKVFAIGLDVEEIITDDTVNSIMQTVVNENEIFLIENALRQDIIFTIIFSIKESFFKAVYPSVRLYFDFHAVSISHIDWTSGSITFTLNQQLGVQFMRGSIFSGRFKILEDGKVITLVKIASR